MLSDGPIVLHTERFYQSAPVSPQLTSNKRLSLQAAHNLRKPCTGIHDDALSVCECSSPVLASIDAQFNNSRSADHVSPAQSTVASTISTSSSSAFVAQPFSLNDSNRFQVIRSICDGGQIGEQSEESAPGSSDESAASCVCESYLVKEKHSGQHFIFKPQSGEAWHKPAQQSRHRRVSSDDGTCLLVEPMSADAANYEMLDDTMESEDSAAQSKAQLGKTPEISIIANSHEPTPVTSPTSSGSSSSSSSDATLPLSDTSSIESFSSRPSALSTASSELRVPLKHGVEYGECAVKELAAYVLDHGHFAQVPPTTLAFVQVPQKPGQDEVEGSSSASRESTAAQEDDQDSKKHHGKKNIGRAVLGSLQYFCENDGSAEDFGPSLFPADEVHKIGILDIRLLNLDRHLGNLLVRRTDDHRYALIPIDHGYTLPAYTNLSDVHFEWTSWWRQCRQPFNKHTLKYIQALNPLGDALRLRQLGIRDESLVSLVFSSLLLKRAALHGCNLETIANMCQRQQDNCPSTLELIIQKVIHKLKNGQVRQRREHRRSNSHSQPSSPPMTAKKQTEGQSGVNINVVPSPDHPLRKLRQSLSTVDLQAVKEWKQCKAAVQRKVDNSATKSPSSNQEHTPGMLPSSAAAASGAPQALAVSAFWSHCGELLSVMTADAQRSTAKPGATTAYESSPPCSPPDSPAGSSSSSSASSTPSAYSDSAKRLIDVLELTVNLIDQQVYKAKVVQDQVEALEKSKQTQLQRSSSEQRPNNTSDKPKPKECTKANSPKPNGLSRMTHSMTEMDLTQLAKAKNAHNARPQADRAHEILPLSADMMLTRSSLPGLPAPQTSSGVMNPLSSSSSSLSNSSAFPLLPPPVHQLHSVKGSSPLAAAISLVRRMHSNGNNAVHLLNSSRQRISVQV